MSDRDRQFDLNDELLSAYLDGELSADERAAVEARLATDPAAQQMLHELRSVSQSVQALPTQSLGRDLSEEVLRRAREAKLPLAGAAPAKSLSKGEPASLAGELSKVRVFNSKRALAWAAMTLAAGLLIMFVQSGDKANKNLPPVAARDRAIVAQDEKLDDLGQIRREVSISAEPKPSAPAPTTVAESDRNGIPMSAAAPKVGEAISPQGNLATAETAAGAPGSAPLAAPSPALRARKEEVSSDRSGLVAPAPNQTASDKVAPAGSSTQTFSGGSGAIGGALPSDEAKQKSRSSSAVAAKVADQQFFIVRVVARPESLQNGSFDRLLAANKVEFVPGPTEKPGQGPGMASGKILKQVESETASTGALNKSSVARTTDVVLVEAPLHTIELFLSDLAKYPADFPTIAVSEQPQSQSHDGVDTQSAPLRKLTENSKRLGTFNRGAFAEATKDNVHDFAYYFGGDKPRDDVVTNGQPRAGGVGGGGGALFDKGGSEGNSDPKLGAIREPVWRFKDQPLADVRRARGVETRHTDDRKAGESQAEIRAARTPAGAEMAKRPMSQRRAEDQLEAKSDIPTDNLQVLFVVTADQPAAPASTATSPATATPAVTPSAPAASPPK
jgi:hypothetical protein